MEVKSFKQTINLNKGVLQSNSFYMEHFPSFPNSMFLKKRRLSIIICIIIF